MDSLSTTGGRSGRGQERGVPLLMVKRAVTWIKKAPLGAIDVQWSRALVRIGNSGWELIQALCISALAYRASKQDAASLSPLLCCGL